MREVEFPLFSQVSHPPEQHGTRLIARVGLRCVMSDPDLLGKKVTADRFQGPLTQGRVGVVA